MNHLVSYLGSGGFGTIIGWYVYYINRYRKGDVQFSDLTTLVGVIGGGAITPYSGMPSTSFSGRMVSACFSDSLAILLLF